MIEHIAPRILAAFSSVVPVFRLPVPTGPFPVGTAVVSLGSASELQLWYPARREADNRLALYEPVLPGKRNQIFRWVRTAAMLDAPLADGGPFPPIVYVNGWNGTRWGNTALVLELASHGFVVASTDQPTGVLDGVDLSADMDFSSPAAQARTLQVIPVKLRAQVRAVVAVLDRTTELNADAHSRFAGRFDLSRAGIVGFSFGGATAAETALTDTRVRAAINMDGTMFGEAGRIGPPFPFLKMNDGSTVTDAQRNSTDFAIRLRANMVDDSRRRMRANFARNGGYNLTIPGTLHSNFSDFPILVPWRRFSGAGPINAARAGEIVRQWVVGFFNFTLLGCEWPPATPDPEAVLESWPPPDRDPAGHDERAHASPSAGPR